MSRGEDIAASEPPVRIGIVLDVRAQGFDTLTQALTMLRERGWTTHLVFLEATNESLVRRFESVRRPHPLQGKGRLLDAIIREREVLAGVRASAETVIDTSGLNVHQLSRKISPLFVEDSSERLRMAVLSFGFKYGVPLDADFVLDMRFLPNPHWVPSCASTPGGRPRSPSSCSASPVRASSSTASTPCCVRSSRGTCARTGATSPSPWLHGGQAPVGGPRRGAGLAALVERRRHLRRPP